MNLRLGTSPSSTGISLLLWTAVWTVQPLAKAQNFHQPEIKIRHQTGQQKAKSSSSKSPSRSPATSTHQVEHILADDTSKDPTFEEFCKKLTAAAKNHDKQFVIESISPEISMDLGGKRGLKAFLDQWQDLSENSAFWGFLEKSISHGAQFDSEFQEFHAPAITFEDSHSERPQCIAWNKNSKLHAKPAADAALLRAVYDEQMTMLDPIDPEPITVPWIKAKCADGTIGYISNSEVYGAYDEFIVFAKRNHKWCITWFGYAGL